jgi:hypothetical protein
VTDCNCQRHTGIHKQPRIVHHHTCPNYVGDNLGVEYLPDAKDDQITDLQSQLTAAQEREREAIATVERGREVMALLTDAGDKWERMQAVVSAARVLIERHERFHPNFWARERNCPECTFCHAAWVALEKETP